MQRKTIDKIWSVATWANISAMPFYNKRLWLLEHYLRLLSIKYQFLHVTFYVNEIRAYQYIWPPEAHTTLQFQIGTGHNFKRNTSTGNTGHCNIFICQRWTYCTLILAFCEACCFAYTKGGVLYRYNTLLYVPTVRIPSQTRYYKTCSMHEYNKWCEEHIQEMSQGGIQTRKGRWDYFEY
jgi:hypothetical protein